MADSVVLEQANSRPVEQAKRGLAVNGRQLPVPPHFDPGAVGKVWRVAYQQRAEEAAAWAKRHTVPPAESDRMRICLVIVDCQNTFCIPGFELFVGGRSGVGAVDDNVRLCEFIYRNLGLISEIVPTMDTHTAVQIFHPIFWINETGEHPKPHTVISLEDVEKGVWKANPVVAFGATGGDTSVIHQDVDRAPLLDDARYHVVHLRLVGHVGGDGDGFSSPGLYLGRHGLSPLQEEVVDGYFGPFLRQREDDGAADAATRPRDDSHLVLES